MRGLDRIAGGMNARTALAATLLALAVAGAGLAPAGAQQGSAANETAATGEHSVAAIAAERASVAGAVERRQLARDLETAPDARARAAVVAAHLNASRERLAALERREADLDAATTNGSLGPATRTTRGAPLAAGAVAVRRLAVDLRTAAAALPRETRRDAGVRLAALDRLREEAAALAERNRGPGSADGSVYADIGRMVTAYNERGAPEGALADRLRGEPVNLRVDGASGDGVVSFRVDGDGRLTGVRAGPRGDATLRLETDGRTVERIAAAEDPAARLRRAADEGDVTVSGIGGPLTGLRRALADLLDALADLL
jgi:hypothetical protein